MANPTTAKPATAEIITTAATIGASMRCFLGFLGNGIFRDAVSNVLGEPSRGFGGGGTGLIPELNATGFTVNSLTDPIYKVRAGSKSIVLPGRGWISGTAPAPRTMAVVLRINAVSPDSEGVSTVDVWGNGSNSSLQVISYQIATDGTITLGLNNGETFKTSGLTLLTGRWYAIALTFTANTGSPSRLWQVYDYTAQALLAGTPVSVNDTSSNIPSSTSYQDAVLCPNEKPGRFNPQGSYDVYAACLHDGTWDSGTNTFFADFYTDPFACIRGTYAPANGGLTAGGAVCLETTDTAITVACARPTNGATAGAATYTYQWYASDTGCDFVPGAGNILAGKTSQICVDTTAVRGFDRWYKCVQSTTQASGTTVTTAVVGGRLAKGVLRTLYIGDSELTNGTYHSPTFFTFAAAAAGYKVCMLNRGKGSSGASSTSAATDWRMNTTQDAVNGQAGRTLLAYALTAAASAFDDFSKVDVHIPLGVNDAGNSISQASQQANVGLIANYLLGSNADTQLGFKRVFLHSPCWRNDSGFTTDAIRTLIKKYQASYAALDNGTTILAGDREGYSRSLSLPQELGDYLHWEGSAPGAGMAMKGSCEWVATQNIIEPRGQDVGSGPDRCPIIVNKADTTVAVGAKVRVSTDSAGANMVTGTLITDSFGTVYPYLFSGRAYYVWAESTAADAQKPIVGTSFTAVAG